MWPGVLAWTLFCLVAVALRGVRWDENYEFAQVLLRRVPYPDGHPLAQYVHAFYSLQTWALAAWMTVCDGPLLANAARNLLFLWMTVMPVFLLGTRLSGQSRWGHAAALLVLMGIHVPFYSNYPVQVWPSLYSNGHIGLGWAVLTVYCLASAHRRFAWFLFGLMPAVHLGQFPPVLVVILCHAWWTRREPAARAAWGYGLIGLAVCGVFWGIQRAQVLPPPTQGPYANGLDPEMVFRGYMAHFASHRALPWGTGQILLAGMVLLGGGLLYRETRAKRMGSPAWWIGLYGGVVTVLVWGTMAAHMALGNEMPRLLLAWMPYRLINHLSLLLLPMMLALLAGRDAPRQGAWIIVLSLLYGVLRPLMGVLIPETWYHRYLENGEAVYFLLYGAAAAALARQLFPNRRFFVFWILQAAVMFCALAGVHHFGAACCLLGALCFLAPLSAAPLLPNRVFALTAGLLLAVLLGQQALHREHLPRTPFEREVRAYLARQDEPDAMVLVRHEQESLQARLGHPVMTDMATTTWIPYQPGLGPALCVMYRDLYGINLAAAPGEAPAARPWFQVWPEKTREEWRRLGHEYGFHYVLAPAFMELDLPCVVAGPDGKLYVIEAAR